MTVQVAAHKRRESNSAESLYEAAEGFVPEIRRRALKMERARRLDDDLVDAMDAAGLFSVIVPKRWGGAGLGPREVNRVSEILGSADCSTAWVSTFFISDPDELTLEFTSDPKNSAEIGEWQARTAHGTLSKWLAGDRKPNNDLRHR
jgi:alkylation response protein AidB-like acyl-CoA dehydrogenase